jgi:hypothetical protein
MAKFKFSKMLRDPGEQQGIKDYLDAYKAEALRRKVEGERLNAMFEDVLLDLRQKHRIPHGLTVLIDPNHLDEHGFIIIHSQETVDGGDADVAAQERRTIQ